MILARIPLISKGKLSSTVLVTLSFPLDIKGIRAKITDIKVSQNLPGENLKFLVFRISLNFYFPFYFVDSPIERPRFADYLRPPKPSFWQGVLFVFDVNTCESDQFPFFVFEH